MNFDQWLAGHGYDAAALNAPEQATQRKHLEFAWTAETQPAAARTLFGRVPTEAELSVRYQVLAAIRHRHRRTVESARETREATSRVVSTTVVRSTTLDPTTERHAVQAVDTA